MRLSQTSQSEITVGQVINLLSNDANRLDTSMEKLHYLWVGPMQTVVTAVLLLCTVGFSSLAGVAVVVLFLPVQGVSNR